MNGVEGRGGTGGGRGSSCRKVHSSAAGQVPSAFQNLHGFVLYFDALILWDPRDADLDPEVDRTGVGAMPWT